MVGKLQYSSSGDNGTYADVGTIRLMRGKDYKVEPVTAKNREDILEILCYKIKVRVIVQNIPSNFLSNAQYYFRIAFQEESQVIGTDTNNYYCHQNHVGSSSNRPITGAEWANYWLLGGSFGVAWENGASYVKADHIVLGLQKYKYSHDALMQIHGIVHHKIEIEFTCHVNDVGNYKY